MLTLYYIGIFTLCQDADGAGAYCMTLIPLPPSSSSSSSKPRRNNSTITNAVIGYKHQSAAFQNGNVSAAVCSSPMRDLLKICTNRYLYYVNILIREPAVAETANKGKFITTSSFTRVGLLIVNNLQDIIRMLLKERI